MTDQIKSKKKKIYKSIESFPKGQGMGHWSTWPLLWIFPWVITTLIDICVVCQVFEANTGRLVISLEDHVNSVSFCCFMNQGQSVVAVSNNCVKVLLSWLTLNNNKHHHDNYIIYYYLHHCHQSDLLSSSSSVINIIYRYINWVIG